nr:MAG TPA: hypothetical protein [Caudoviricetes sp.]
MHTHTFLAQIYKLLHNYAIKNRINILNCVFQNQKAEPIGSANA